MPVPMLLLMSVSCFSPCNLGALIGLISHISAHVLLVLVHYWAGFSLDAVNLRVRNAWQLCDCGLKLVGELYFC